jgi:hypothetical protein
MVGTYQGEAVWLEMAQGSEGIEGVIVAVSLGSAPLEGFLCTADCAGAGGANLTGDAAFDQAYGTGGLPREVAVLALQDPHVRAAVHRRFHGVKAGNPVGFRMGYLSTSGEFFQPSPFGVGRGRHRPPSHEEAASLIADLVLLAQRFRGAYQTVLTQMAQTQGQAAAAAWDRRLRTAQAAATSRSRTITTCFTLFAVGLVVFILALALIAVVFMESIFAGT